MVDTHDGQAYTPNMSVQPQQEAQPVQFDSEELKALYRTAKSFVIQYEAISKKREVSQPA